MCWTKQLTNGAPKSTVLNSSVSIRHLTYKQPCTNRKQLNKKGQLRLLATGRKEAAEQEKQAAILKAQGAKESAILKAEGDAQAVELVAEAQAKAIKVVSESANQYFKENAQLNKKLDVVRDTFSQQTKIVVPSSADILNVIGLENSTVIPVGNKKKTTS